MIDYTFENNTKPFIMNQFFFYVLVFCVPFFVMTLCSLEGKQEMLCAYYMLAGSLSMFSFEVMAIVVDPRGYFLNKWNWFDCLQLILTIALFTIIHLDNENPNDNTSDYW